MITPPLYTNPSVVVPCASFSAGAALDPRAPCCCMPVGGSVNPPVREDGAPAPHTPGKAPCCSLDRFRKSIDMIRKKDRGKDTKRNNNQQPSTPKKIKNQKEKRFFRAKSIFSAFSFDWRILILILCWKFIDNENISFFFAIFFGVRRQ